MYANEDYISDFQHRNVPPDVSSALEGIRYLYRLPIYDQIAIDGFEVDPTLHI